MNGANISRKKQCINAGIPAVGKTAKKINAEVPAVGKTAKKINAEVPAVGKTAGTLLFVWNKCLFVSV